MSIRHCARCATEMRPFEDGRRTGWVCPSCGDIVCRRIPRGYCLAIAYLVLVVGPLLLLAFAPAAGSPIFQACILVCWIVLFGVLIFVPSCVCYWWIKNKRTPIVRTVATVVRTRSRDWELDVPRSVEASPVSMALNRLTHALGIDPMVTVAQWSDFFVTFKTPRGEIELAVPQALSASLVEGDEGLLVYQGEMFKHFVRGVEDQQDQSRL